MKKSLFAVLLATVWISISEFFRNQLLLKEAWWDHYKSMGQVFPAEPVNGAVWGIWSLVFALVIFILFQKFSFTQTCLLAWVIGFLMMWLVIGNLGVLPVKILPFAVPLSMLEVLVAVWIMKKIVGKSNA